MTETATTPAALTVELDRLCADNFRSPPQRCDMVMKGGITSGIVYPPAILRIAQRFRLVNVGGTSAGAIAAAVVSAAEFRRQTDTANPGAGFMTLKTDVLDWLAQGTNLQSLFVPVAPAAPLFLIFLWLIGLPSAFRRPTTKGALNILITAVVLLFALYGVIAAFLGTPDWPLALLAKIVAILVFLIVALCVVTLLKVLPRSNFGTCTGGRAGAAWPNEPLTFWLARQIDSIAGTGRDRPLTFGDLWLGKLRTDADTVAAKPDEPVMDLQMVTTCLSLGRPYTLPTEAEIFYFRPDEFRRFFPEYVVAWMERHARRADPNNPEQVARHEGLAQRGYLPLPLAADLPVVVATRMSLSFPILLSAVRLWTVDWTLKTNQQNKTRPHIEPAWFSDGGLSSNFPIGMFDSPLPRWPTLGITLEDFPPDADPNDPAQGAAISQNYNENISGSWVRFSNVNPPSNLSGFAGAIVNAMQNWQDALQSEAPGFRDRIAHVRLSSSEGGLNLTMPPSVIARLMQRGERAGELLVEHFAVPPAPGIVTTWENHRRVRVRTTLDVSETYAARFHRAWIAAASAGSPSYPDVLNAMLGPHPAYPFVSEAQLGEAIRVATQLDAVAGTALPATSVHLGAPKPPSELRARPKF